MDVALGTEQVRKFVTGSCTLHCDRLIRFVRVIQGASMPKPNVDLRTVLVTAKKLWNALVLHVASKKFLLP